MVKEKDKATALKELTIPVAGMTCAACVNKVEKVLKRLPGVEEANVSLAAGKAGVVYDPRLASLGDMERAIEDVGYEVPWARIQLLAIGMTDADAVRNALLALPGIVSASVNLATETVSVEFSERLTSAAAVKNTLRDMGFQVTERGEGEDALDRERHQRQAEVRRQLLNMLLAWPLGALVMLGTFSDYEPLKGIVPS